jgi:membrane protease YdiL (CAAX protease family)
MIPTDGVIALMEPSMPAAAVDRRLARAFVATLVVGGWMAIGLAFQLGADGYLLLGIPITIAFQALVVRRPLRAMWVRDAPPLRFGRRAMAAVAAVATAPAVVAVRGIPAGDFVLAAYGFAAMVGAIGAVYALRAMTRDAARPAARASLVNSAILVGVMIVFRFATGGFHGNAGGAVVSAVISVLTYLPVVFVMEEVFFRGLLDPYLHGSTPGRDHATALYGSALWGLWHLPVMSISLGLLTIPYLVGVHTALGLVLVTAWRRTSNLAAPGIAHAVADALRNAVAVL